MPTVQLNTTARITAFAAYTPEEVLTNDYFASFLDTNDEWIVQRTGMKERRKAAEHQYASDLAFEAVMRMTDRYPSCLQGVDAILVATTTPDTFFPSTAAIVQARLKLPDCLALDISNACAGFVSAMQMAIGLIDSGMNKKVIVIGTEVLTKTVDYSDRSTCILFGDGAGAVILESDPQSPASCLAASSVTDGDLSGTLYRTAVSCKLNGLELAEDGKLHQNGREVYKWALQQIPAHIHNLLNKVNLTASDLDIFVPHSANLRMIESLCDRTGIKMDHTLTSVQRYGNTSAASIPLAIEEGIRDGRLAAGKLMLLYGFGGGLSQAGLLIRWTL
ncbi:ketoacyl-ACP synthase III [Paenibacillus sp. UMB4589-SE434]|uniref:ketoacyl-ACP synthase III n=1 Tax=Paenibacillus sp. UMB4589-SE434 TaxID=3046314 RepID=UPI00254A0BA5|nr:ketoacyl-ACP synthase III [Paenibacillus sp. UMB4589-SE434]MDK8183682.1 ketoacyl-ACP synthase III [Paenibacillus sp. UMB4589-SE434]